jgi:hypothetical protein
VARRSQTIRDVTKSMTLIGSTILAGCVGLAILLRPKLVAEGTLPASLIIPPAARQVLKSKMGQHDDQMRALLSRVILLDDDGVARAAGAIFDEPALARPVAGDELNGLLPERFFVLQDELRAQARRLVIASGKRDHEAAAHEFGQLAKTCVSCHQVFLYGDRAAAATRALQPEGAR